MANAKHGDYGTRLYRCYRSMIDRCRRPDINICKEWSDYVDFKAWALDNGYCDGMVFKRHDSSKDYFPDNCYFYVKIEAEGPASRIKECYKSMISRCKHKKSYKEKNIQICQEWLDDYNSFKEWALANGYQEDLTLERKNVWDNYYPDNCYWILLKDQPHNRTNSYYYYVDGVRYNAAKDFTEISGIDYNTIVSRCKSKSKNFENYYRVKKKLDPYYYTQ